MSGEPGNTQVNSQVNPVRAVVEVVVRGLPHPVTQTTTNASTPAQV